MGFDGFFVPDWAKPYVGWAVGMDWPEGDESGCFRLADACAATAKKAAAEHGLAVISQSGQEWDGDALNEFLEHVRSVSGGRMADLVDRLVSAALEFNDLGVQVEYTKRMIEVSVWLLIFQIGWLLAAAVGPWGGVSLALAGARIRLTRLVIAQIGKRLLVNVGMFGALMGGMDLAVQASQSRRDHLDWEQIGMSAGMGALTGGLLTAFTGFFPTRSMWGLMGRSGLASGATSLAPMVFSDQPVDWEAVLKGVTSGVVGGADAHWASWNPSWRVPGVDAPGPGAGEHAPSPDPVPLGDEPSPGPVPLGDGPGPDLAPRSGDLHLNGAAHGEIGSSFSPQPAPAALSVSPSAVADPAPGQVQRTAPASLAQAPLEGGVQPDAVVPKPPPGIDSLINAQPLGGPVLHTEANPGGKDSGVPSSAHPVAPQGAGSTSAAHHSVGPGSHVGSVTPNGNAGQNIQNLLNAPKQSPEAVSAATPSAASPAQASDPSSATQSAGIVTPTAKGNPGSGGSQPAVHPAAETASQAVAHPAAGTVAKPVAHPAPHSIPEVATHPASGSRDVGVSGTPLEIPRMEGYTRIGGQEGSNPGGRYVDPSGQKWYIKAFENDLHARNEVLANLFYREAGVRVPVVELIDLNGYFRGHALGIRSSLVEGVPDLADHLLDPVYLQGLYDDFAVDVFLSNWGIVGLDYDNILNTVGGKVRIDGGGSLLFRPQGDPKGDMFGGFAGETDSLRNSNINPQAAKVFQHVADADIRAGVTKIQKISERRIDQLVDQLHFPPKEAELLKSTLKARRAGLIRRFGTTDDLAVMGIADATPASGPRGLEKPLADVRPARLYLPKEGLVSKDPIESHIRFDTYLNGPSSGVLLDAPFGTRLVSPLWGERVWKEVAENLSGEQRAAIEGYTNGDYVSINKFMRAGGNISSRLPSSEEEGRVIENIKLIDEATRLQPVPATIDSIRAVKLRPAMFSKPIDEIEGTVQTDLGFLSVSIGDRPVRHGAKGYMYIRIPEGTPGIYVDPISLAKGERELLLGFGRSYFVEKVVKSNGTVFFYVWILS